MVVKLYEKLKNINEVQDMKEFMELIHIRAIRINDLPVDDPRYEIEEKDKIRVGIKLIED
jgi:hypothetical protein